MLATPINLAIVEDHALFRKILKSYLSDQKDIKVLIQASNMFELFNELKKSSIDILLMDVFLPGLNGNNAIKALREKHPNVKIIVLSICTDMNLISDMLETGIHGYLSKADEPEDLLLAIAEASSGRIFRNKYFTEALYWNTENSISSYVNNQNASLNEREKRILQLIWKEKSNKEIADELFLGVRSVEKIRQDMKEKIGVKSTVGLLKYGINKRIIDTVYRNSDLIK